MIKMKKQIAVAVTVALLGLPISPVLAQTTTPNAQVMVANITITASMELEAAAEAAVAAYETESITTLTKVTKAESLKAAAVTAVAAVTDEVKNTAFELRIDDRAAVIEAAKASLQVAAAEVAVSAYEDAPITTLTEVVAAEGLKAAAVTAVEAVTDEAKNAAFVLRITDQAAVIATAKASFQVEAVAAAEVAVLAYEEAPITKLTEVVAAEGLKAAAVTAVAAVIDEAKNAAFELRIADQAAVIATAKASFQVEAVEAAEAAVSAYEDAPITKLTEVVAAEKLKAAAVTAVEAVTDDAKNAAFELRIANQTTAIAEARTALELEVVDTDGKIIIPSTMFSDLIFKLREALAVDPARKGELNKHQALRKLARANKLMKEGNTEKFQVSLNEYTDKIARAQAFLLEVEDTDSETSKTLARALLNVESSNIQVLGNLVDKLPPQAAQRLALNVVRTMEKAVTKIQKQEAKVELAAVTAEVTPLVSAETEKKHYMEKDVKVALAEFKKAVNEKNKIHIEDLDAERELKDDHDKNVVKQSKPEYEKPEMDRNIEQVNETERTHVTVVPVKTQQKETTFRASENKQDDREKMGDHDKDNGKNDRDDNRSDRK